MFYVYQLVDPRDSSPFYIGKGCNDRGESHLKTTGNMGNPHKKYKIDKLRAEGVEPICEIVKYFTDEDKAYAYEEELIESIGLANLTNMKAVGRGQPKGWKPSKECLEKRSASLKGIPRTKEWCEKLSKAKQGKNNPMYGVPNPCSEERRYKTMLTKNKPNYELYKQAIELMNDGASATSVAKQLGIGKGVCYLLKNRTHNFFICFPELN